jgi:hypothetical protein
VAAVTVLVAVTPRTIDAADQWVEVKSAHFVVTSNAGAGSAKTLAWQLEQIRSALATLWPWAKLDLNKPLKVLAVKDEASMRALAPSFWEQRGGVRPACVWVGGVDQNYLAIRSDLKAEDTVNINPYVSAYFSYVSLILQQNSERHQPLWFSRGIAGVLSNTIVRESGIMLGPPIPWHLDHLRSQSRLRLAKLLEVTASSPELKSGDGLNAFDAESWALVHYLMFGEEGARWPKLDKYAQLVATGTDSSAAFKETLGPPDDLESGFANYVARNLFTFRRVNVDASVKREGFAVRQVPAAESASDRALFHAAMNRPVEARAAIDEARKADAGAAESYVAEALLLDREQKRDEARAAYEHAVTAGSASGYAYYRLAGLLWLPPADHETLTRIEALLSKAVSLNIRDAAASADFGEVRSELGTSAALPYVLRAISLDPSEPAYRFIAARVLWRETKLDEAEKAAQAGLALAQSDDERKEAADLLERIRTAKAAGGARPAAE